VRISHDKSFIPKGHFIFEARGTLETRVLAIEAALHFSRICPPEARSIQSDIMRGMVFLSRGDIGLNTTVGDICNASLPEGELIRPTSASFSLKKLTFLM
jgi:hypothetical protein